MLHVLLVLVINVVLDTHVGNVRLHCTAQACCAFKNENTQAGHPLYSLSQTEFYETHVPVCLRCM